MTRVRCWSEKQVAEGEQPAAAGAERSRALCGLCRVSGGFQTGASREKGSWWELGSAWGGGAGLGFRGRVRGGWPSSGDVTGKCTEAEVPGHPAPRRQECVRERGATSSEVLRSQPGHLPGQLSLLLPVSTHPAPPEGRRVPLCVGSFLSASVRPSVSTLLTCYLPSWVLYNQPPGLCLPFASFSFVPESDFQVWLLLTF